MSEATYFCSVCGKQVKVKKGKPVPLCCHKEMEPLAFCTAVPHAEMARDDQGVDPCDDGTQPRKPK
ncbi:MAG: hypothetical protein ABR951_02570 [Candidatus Aminicenantales bacterium]|jgi:hypothetical protein